MNEVTIHQTVPAVIDCWPRAWKLHCRGRLAPHAIADMGSYTLWMAFFRDPDGHLLAIMAEVAK